MFELQVLQLSVKSTSTFQIHWGPLNPLDCRNETACV